MFWRLWCICGLADISICKCSQHVLDVDFGGLLVVWQEPAQ